MGTRSFVDVYEQMINRHNKKAMNDNTSINDHTDIIKQADDQKENQEQEQNEEDLDLNLGESEQEQSEDVQDENQELESDEQEDDFDLNLDDEQLDKQPQSEYNPEDFGEENTVELNFSVELATEFSNTVNQFTKLCADVVKNRSVKKNISDDLDKLMGKIKNIVQAAEKSV